MLRLKKSGALSVNASTPGVIYNQSQIVERYEDDWFVTGAERHRGSGVAVTSLTKTPPGHPDLHSDDSSNT